MPLFSNIHDTIGQTPLVPLNQFKQSNGTMIYAKLEYFNPGGSVKDRLGQAIIEEATSSGKVKPGGTIIEPTAGNTGIGLALAAQRYDINLIVCVPRKFSIEKQILMEALGAKLVHTDSSLGMKGAIDRAKQLQLDLPESYVPQQFANPVNPKAYYDSLAPELWSDLNGQIDLFVAGAGTGGTFAGTARFLKEKSDQIKTVIVEPEGSIIAGGEPGPHKTEGIGMEKIPPYMNESHFDAIHTVSDEDAFDYVDQLAKKEGLLVGSSSGSAMHAAVQEAKIAPADSKIVVIFPDSSERYLSKDIYQGGKS
ncbi:O-acetylserine dependent cystathionine beta-synthase [Pelagirhabdus alkalitolerans]|uniref:O-acetylserine dependent cystathionine beta-synthase n=1 Tax=Pelagirhabdus alkalitolerans TaxID=1612202 RepID=A0A1G6GNR6_9BACI|nr:cysteine synthase family protein [Pelagirhabdus alkalitolerans]SDB83569.1 O-acetylserine dependent cystathionine beta-synthase [Pelagirhabdus alkalitolerans]